MNRQGIYSGADQDDTWVERRGDDARISIVSYDHRATGHTTYLDDISDWPMWAGLHGRKSFPLVLVLFRTGPRLAN